MYDLICKLDDVCDVVTHCEFIINDWKYYSIELHVINSTNIIIFLVYKQFITLRASLVETRCRSPTDISLLNISKYK